MNSTTQITTNNITNVTTDKLEITIIYISFNEHNFSLTKSKVENM